MVILPREMIRNDPMDGLIRRVEKSDFGVFVMKSIRHMSTHNPSKERVLRFCSPLESMNVYVGRKVDLRLRPRRNIVAETMDDGRHKDQPKRIDLNVVLEAIEQKKQAFIDVDCFSLGRRATSV
jgi:hypothetical protein